MAFIIETWINKEEDMQLITSQLKCLGYNIIAKKQNNQKRSRASMHLQR